MNASGIDASKRPPLRITQNNHPYSSSVASSASSSSSSIFSSDAHSSQSSAPSSSKSILYTGWDSEHSETLSTIDYRIAAITPKSQDGGPSTTRPFLARERLSDDAVAPELRLNPRRTQAPSREDVLNGCSAARPPPTLVRQCDRKDNFVESLVDTTTQMIEVIWPLSVVPCGRDTVLGGKNLIGLRIFIQEVLKRSKTSYSTLQVALYYLVLIKPYVPGIDFTMEQSEDSHSIRAMQCGRRMFLAALILASKYLQDRNYSARAWSKISGLKISEINTNEMAFVTAIDWRLHVPEPLFQRWTDVVLKFSPPSSPSSPTLGRDVSYAWRSIVPLLTPSLDAVDLLNMKRPTPYRPGAQAVRPLRQICTKKLPMSPPSLVDRKSSPCSSSDEQTPTMPYSKPPAMEPTIRGVFEDRPRFPPISPTLSLLPTPQITPQLTSINTPAVSAGGFFSGRSSMSGAMKHINGAGMARTTIDTWPTSACRSNSASSAQAFPATSRRSSLARSASSVSSPDSMVSDLSSRSSRSSSISSVASSACALPQPSLAVQATRRCANMQLVGIKEGCKMDESSPPEHGAGWDRHTSSPMSYALGPKESYLRESPAAVRPRASLPTFSDQDAAEGLRDLALNRQHRTLPPPSVTSNPLHGNRKRERPSSISDPVLQQTVRSLLQTRTFSDITDRRSSATEDDGTVLMDAKVADSFVLLPNFKLPQLASATQVHDSHGNARKRACYMEEMRGGFGLEGRAGAAGSGGFDSDFGSDSVVLVKIQRVCDDDDAGIAVVGEEGGLEKGVLGTGLLG
ncbi:hypothetical protein MMC26_004221 [Xylographa opegraphella]|nr:hypothetical protein [Xylographa opegraphella]